MYKHQNTVNVLQKLQYATVNCNLPGHMPITDMLSFINNYMKTVLGLKHVTDIFHSYSCH